ncbi:MAG: Holliday junction resolvase RuvX [Coriobacteriia bacterium]|jgi:putative Holliday junction resolvase|nr:Holliday junction resolvase RuvX [Coriobacteriia bacterium]MDR2715026.1 Holliday junction resolvase RuvX [Coriobacteriales bacterium]
MRILALDIGEKRCGIAVSDAAQKIAFPISTLSTQEVMDNHPSFKRILEDYEPELLLCGLPVSLDGTEHSQAKRIRTQAQHISEQTEIPLAFTDERLSSAQARRALKEAGQNERLMRGKIDMVAASLFLQSYLDCATLTARKEV